MIKISFTADPLPSDFRGTLQDFQDRFLLNLRGSISGTSVLTGQVGGTRPMTNVGPWLNGDTWYVWNGADYVPSTVKVGGAGFVVQLTSATTVGDTDSLVISSNTQSLQDKDGVVALLSDVYVGRSAIVMTGITPSIDWNLGHNFTHVLPANSTYSMKNSLDGQEIVIASSNIATSFTIAWPSNIFWTGGSAPAQTASKTDLYMFKNIAGSIFGRQVANY